MYKDHPTFKKVDISDGDPVWRYMDFQKFYDLLNKKQLFFCRTDKFQDRWEYTYPKKNRNRKARLVTVTNIDTGISHNEVITSISPFNQVTSTKEIKKQFAVNCWNAGDEESDALWKIYATLNAGVAIKSTFGSLKNAFSRSSDEIYIGGVKYINYNADGDEIDEAQAFEPLMHKRVAFSHEREVRAVIWKPKQGESFATDNGQYVPVDLTTLIHEVVVSPGASSWFVENVKDIITVKGFSFACRKSDHLDEPT